jgi:hypothetical protein
MASSTAGTGRRYIVRRSTIHGRGVFALADIPKGTRLMEYIGERISHREADRRYAAEHEHSPHTMLFSVDDKTVIDATKWGNSARFINHSCTPNCEAIEEQSDTGGAAYAGGEACACLFLRHSALPRHPARGKALALSFLVYRAVFIRTTERKGWRSNAIR